jgi:CBS domain-containing protein
MNPELFRIGPEEPAASALGGILAMGITAAPVLDESRHPLGVVSLRDLVEAPVGARAAERMTSPADAVRDDARIGDAARLIGETGHRHLVVVDSDGRAVGMVSAVDVVRALTGLPARHPAAFPHLDMRTGLTWTEDMRLDSAHVDAISDSPGLILLVRDAPGAPRRVVWAEVAGRAFTRLTDMLSLPQEDPELERLLEERAPLHFRVGTAFDKATLKKGLAEVLRDKGLPHGPGTPWDGRGGRAGRTRAERKAEER